MEELVAPPPPSAEGRLPLETRSEPAVPGISERNLGVTSVLLASAAIVTISALAFGLIGSGVIGHFVLLVFYGAAALALGAFLVRPTLPKSLREADPVSASAVSSTLDGSFAVGTGGVSRSGASNGPESRRQGATTASSKTASPLDWVGETVEGSLSWLVGNNLVGNRRRSKSAGGALLGGERDYGGGGSPASSPGAGGRRDRKSTFGRLGRAALGDHQPGVSRVWPRIGSGGRAVTPGDNARVPDGHEGVGAVADGGDEREGDQLEEDSKGNDSETDSLPSAANSSREGDSVDQHRGTAGETSGGVEATRGLNWEVDGRREMLRRYSASIGIPTKDNQMVQDLLEMISDKPMNHAGQWRPVRVRRGIHIWTSTVEGSPYCRIRGRMRCEATPAQLLSLLIDDERIGEYDRMFDRYELVERPNDRTSVRWTCYLAIWPARPRDFVIRSTWEEFADGTVVIATCSVEHEDCPETTTFVRGKMVMCGYVICPLGERRRRRRSSGRRPAMTVATEPGDAAGASSTDATARRSLELWPSSEITMYAHTDLGGYLPASVINKLCKKPAYRVLRKIQNMIDTRTLVKLGESGEGHPVGGRVPTRRSKTGMSRHDSDDLLGSLVAEGMPDHEAAANLEDVPEGEMEGASGVETETPGRTRRSSPSNAASDGGASSRRNSVGQPGPSTPSPLLPGLSRDVAIEEAQRIMKTINRMAADESLGWSELGVASHSDMALYKSPVMGTKKVRLGASTFVAAESSELVGILLENAAILGPDYIVDRQELLETFSSSITAGVGSSEAAGVEGEERQHDTAIYWFSCTHKRQRICRDFVILRCFRRLPGSGGVIAYSSVDHPGLPPCPDYVRGRLDVSGFVILPSSGEADEDGPSQAEAVQVQHRSDESRHKRRPNDRSGGGANGHAPEDEGSDLEEVVARRGASTRGGRDRRAEREAAVSEVTFFTHLTFSAYLPDIQEMEACRHFVGPLHILQELKWVVERTLGASQDDEVAVEAAARLLAGGAGGGGADWGDVSGESSSAAAEEAGARGADGEAGTCEGTRTPASSVSTSEGESAHTEDATVSNAVRLKVVARREAALRDMLAFASDGEGMDGPQVDWRMMKDGDGMKLWRAAVPTTVWCMIRTRAAVPAPPLEVLTYLLDDSCISEYDELFDKIEVIEPIDDSSTFKRTCYKPMWPTAPRDFSLLSSWGILEDGTAYLLNRSVDHPMNPPKKGFVRGAVMLCGFLMVPRAPESGGGCTITMIVHSDLGGKLPVSLINMLSTSSPWRLMQRLRGAFESAGGRPTRSAAAAAAVANSGQPPAQGVQHLGQQRL